MVVKFNVDSGANIHSCRTRTFNLNNPKDVQSFGYTKEEWMELDESDKLQVCDEWAAQAIEIYYEEEGTE